MEESIAILDAKPDAEGRSESTHVERICSPNSSELLPSSVYALPGVGYDSLYIDLGEALC